MSRNDEYRSGLVKRVARYLVVVDMPFALVLGLVV
jgi:uncharacterized protein YceK